MSQQKEGRERERVMRRGLTTRKMKANKKKEENQSRRLNEKYRTI